MLAPTWLPPALQGLPPQSGDSIDPTPFAVLLLAGFVVGIAGHVVKSRIAVAAGVLMIFLAAFLLPLAAVLTR
jgi:hypothetical protein